MALSNWKRLPGLSRVTSRRPLTARETITAAVVALSVAFVVSQLQPSLLVTNSMTAGGDMGAHVWLPQFVKDHLIPHGRVTGWTPDWYAGFPALTFYFPLPALLTVALSYVMPYAVAFKLVTISGVALMPFAAYLFGRLARLPFPAPACLAAATIPFLFDTGYNILGGNIASTLAGEFSFSIALSLALVLLGLVAGGLDTGRRRAWAAILFGAILVSHVIPTLFAVVCSLILIAMRVVLGVPSDVPLAAAAGVTSGKSHRRVRLAYLAGTLLIVGAIAGDWFLVENPGAGGVGGAIGRLVFFLVGVAGLVVWVGAARQTEPGFVGTGRLSALRWAIPVGFFGACLSGFWTVPFVMRSHYMNDMGWEKIGTGTAAGMQLYDKTITFYTDALFPSALTPLIVLAFVSGVFSLLLARRIGSFLVLVAAAMAAGFILAPQGRLWNARLLPFWYLSLYLLAGLLVADVLAALAAYIRQTTQRAREERQAAASTEPVVITMEGEVAAPVAPEPAAVPLDSSGDRTARWIELLSPVVAFLCALAVVVHTLPTPGWWPAKNSVFPWHDPAKSGASFIPGWASWNYSGYDGRLNNDWAKAAYPEYKTLVDTMYDVGKTDGCGRAMWEYEPTLDRFGTPMALMLLPMWTKGCIGSMEGLFFESSPTVAFHFLNQSLLSKEPSSAMRDLPYKPLDVADGVTRLQILGVRYYMAVSPEAQQQAATDQRLKLVSTVPAAAAADGTQRTWNIYKIADSDIVAPLTNLPAVMTSMNSVSPIVHENAKVKDLSYRAVWLENSVKWYEDPALFDVPLAESGPSDWPRVANADETPVRTAAEPVKVSTISSGDDSISFDVDKVGVPVLVKMSYFPNWQVHGGKGPYRVTPNQMVVIPTSKHVSLHYGRTPVDWYGSALTVVGVAGVLWLWRRDRDVAELVKAREDETPAQGS